MNNFAEASRLKLRFTTQYGQLAVENLWDLSLSKLSNIIKDVKKEIKKEDDDELSFLDETKKVDKIQELKFEILKEIYLIKKQESEDSKNEASIKAHNEYIDGLIYEKEQADLKKLSVEDLKALRK